MAFRIGVIRLGSVLLAGVIFAVTGCESKQPTRGQEQPPAALTPAPQETSAPTAQATAEIQTRGEESTATVAVQHEETSPSEAVSKPGPSAPSYIAENLMAAESSPYLRSLTTSPVHWHSWTPEVLQAAQAMQRPLLISIGESWSRSARALDVETFGDEKLAQYVNENFVPVKIDADEHPEVAERYRLFYALIRQQEIPDELVVVALPSGLPYEATGYLPAVKNASQPMAMDEFLSQTVTIFRNQPAAAQAQAEKFAAYAKAFQHELLETTASAEQVKEKARLLATRVVENAAATFAKRPTLRVTPYAAEALLALQHYSDTRSTPSLELAQKLLQELYRSALRDPIFGGYFHEVDEAGYPKSGKLLCDQAQLLKAFTAAYAATGKKLYREAAEEILRFMRDTLEANGGGFYSSQEVDLEPTHEAAYFTWSANEIQQSDLDELEKQVLLRYYGLDSLAPDTKVLLRPARTLQSVATSLKRDADSVQKALDEGRRKLREARYERDDFPRINKAQIVSWSAMAISAYSDVWRYLGDEEARNFALRSAASLLDQATTGPGLAHYIVRGAPLRSGPTLLEDHVAAIEALLDSAEISGNQDLLKTAEVLAEHMHNSYSLSGKGLYRDCQAGEQLQTLLEEVPLVPLRDGLIPSPNALAARGFLRLFLLTEKDVYLSRVIENLAPITTHDEWWDAGMASTAQVASLAAAGAPKAVIVGESSRPETQELWRTALGTFRAGKSVLLLSPDQAANTDYLPSKDRKPIAYICTHDACSPPVNTAAKLRVTLWEFGRD